MADIKFSEFPKATTSKDSDEIAILQDGVNKMIASPVLESKIINKTVSRVIEQGGASLNVVNLKGVVPTYADLALITPEHELNDAYQVEADGLVYVYTENGFQEDGEGFKVQPNVNGVVEEGNTQAVSGGEVFSFIENNSLFKEAAVLDQIGSISFLNGVVNSSNTNFRHNIPIDLKKGERVIFGSNVSFNEASTSTLLCKYNSSGVFLSSIINIKDISSTQFYEGEWIADEDCKVSLVTNTTVNLGLPYLNVFQKRFVLDSELDARINVGVDKYVKEPTILIEKTEALDLIGYYYNNGDVNTITDTTRRTDFIYLKSGERIEFGVNGTANPASPGAILNIYDINKVLLENKIKFIEHISVWFESSFTATQDCYVGVSTTTTNYDPIKIPYVKSFKSNKYLLNVDDIDNLVPNNDDFLNVKEKSDLYFGTINAVTHINENSKIIISGTSFSYSANGWFELMCTKLGIEGVNKSYSGERINNFSARILNGTFFSKEILNECDALMIMHTHNKDVYTLRDIVVNGNTITAQQLKDFTPSDYEDLSWDILTDGATGWDGPDAEFAAVWDYVLKKIQEIYYIEKDNEDSIYYGTEWGKPFNIVVTTSWHDGRTKFNESIRKLSAKWGLTLCRFDENTGFNRRQLHVSGQQHSILYAMMKPGNIPDTENINGEAFAWHYERGQDKPLVKRMAATAKRCFEVF